MAVPILVKITLDCANGLPEDDATIDLTLSMESFDSGDADVIKGWLDDFFTDVQTIPGVDHPVSDWIGGSWTASAGGTVPNVTYDMYDLTGHLDGSPTGSPAFTRTSSLDHASSTCFPAEVALKISAHGDLDGIPETAVNPAPPPATIRPAGRRRGGFYIPWIVKADSAVSVVAGVVRPSQDLIDTLASAASNNLMALLDQPWSIWSRADEELFPVVAGYVDNAFDTIRKRGPAPTARTTFASF